VSIIEAHIYYTLELSFLIGITLMSLYPKLGWLEIQEFRRRTK
jgi:hypothetical protein